MPRSLSPLPERQGELSLGPRPERIAELESREFDLLVVGGGITGCGIALDAAARGLSIALVEARDFASGTSSRSTKLIHGGLRYLRQREFGLVREASAERRLLQHLAPGLVSSIPFVLPVYSSRWESLTYRAGLTLYDLVAGFRDTTQHRRLSNEDITTHHPGMRRDGLKSAYRYFDAVTDDARLTLQVAKVAASLGAVCVNHAPVTALLRQASRTTGAAVTDSITGRDFRIKARKVVLAGGVWLDDLLALDTPRVAPRLAPTRGIHIVLPGDYLPAGTAFALTAPADGRLVFAIPWHHRTFVGTTDSPYDGDPANPPFNLAEVDYLLDAVNHHFPDAGFVRADVVAVQSGLRPLISRAGRGLEDLSRRHRLIRTPPGVLAVGGGKLTTYRRIAGKTVDAVLRDLTAAGMHFPDAGLDTENVPLNRRIGHEPPARACGVSGLAPTDYLTWAYGAHAPRMTQPTTPGGDPAGRELLPGRPYLESEVSYSVRREMAVNLSDFMSQRLRCLLIDHDHGLACAGRVAAIMGKHLGWDEREQLRQVENYRALATRHSLTPNALPSPPQPNPGSAD